MRWRVNIDLRIALFIFLYSCIAMFLNPHIDFMELNVSLSIILFSNNNSNFDDTIGYTPLFFITDPGR